MPLRDTPKSKLIDLAVIGRDELNASFNIFTEWLDTQKASRQRRIMEYLFAEEMAGRGHLIKAYSIAIDVFDKDEGFDPAENSLVRVEMHRLRSYLDRFLREGGNSAQYIFVLPSGNYRLMAMIPNGRDDAPHRAAKDQTESETADSADHAVAGEDGRRGQGQAGSSSASGKAVRWANGKKAAVMLFAALCLLSLIAALWWNHRRSLAECQSARPELILPDAVDNTSSHESQDLLGRLAMMLQYYPLVSVLEKPEGKCPGVPQYDLQLAMTRDGLLATVTVRGTSETLLTTNASKLTNADAKVDGRDLATARIAYIIAHDGGAIPLDAMRRVWTDSVPAAEQYRCLMRSHQYFFANAGSHIYAAVRQCLIREMPKATKADVPAMLAAFELEPRMAPGLGRYQTRNYYRDAVNTASQIDTLNSELLVAQLREMRLDTKNRQGDAQITMDSMNRLYPFEPNIRNQVAITQCRLTQEYSAAYRNIDLFRAITQQRNGLIYAEVYCDLATGKTTTSAKYAEAILSDNSLFMQIIALASADERQDGRMSRVVVRRMAELGCDKRQCLIEAATAEHQNPDLDKKLRAAIDRHFPANSAVPVPARGFDPNMVGPRDLSPQSKLP